MIMVPRMPPPKYMSFSVRRFQSRFEHNPDVSVWTPAHIGSIIGLSSRGNGQWMVGYSEPASMVAFRDLACFVTVEYSRAHGAYGSSEPQRRLRVASWRQGRGVHIASKVQA
jgi:hypothetical protein